MRIRRYFGAGIALFRKTINGYEIFLGKRCVKKGFGKWSIPGGGYEHKDNTFQCCTSRKFREEMGRTIPNGEILGIKSFNYPFFHWRTFIVFTAENMDKCWLSEFSEAKWISINEIKNYKLCFGVKQEIKRFLQLERINKRTIDRVVLQSDEYCLEVAKKIKEENGYIIPANLERALSIGFLQAQRIIAMFEKAN